MKYKKLRILIFYLHVNNALNVSIILCCCSLYVAMSHVIHMSHVIENSHVLSVNRYV
jgi:hypothetical protein